MTVSLAALAACYSPKLTSPGHYCHPTDHPACPDNQVCSGDRCVDKGPLVPVDLAAPRDGPPVEDGPSPVDLARADQKALVDLSQRDSPSGCSIKINEIQTAGNAGASDEFVELYNSCASSTALSGYKLAYRSSSGTNDIVFVTFSGTIGGSGFFVAGQTAFSGTPDVRYTGSMAATGGGVAVRDPGGAIVDSVGWGSATNAFVRVSAAPAPATAQSIERLPDGHDTGNNMSDFTVGAMPTPGAANQ